MNSYIDEEVSTQPEFTADGSRSDSYKTNTQLENVDEAEEAFQKILDEEPDWLNDEEYIYDGETEI